MPTKTSFNPIARKNYSSEKCFCEVKLHFFVFVFHLSSTQKIYVISGTYCRKLRFRTRKILQCKPPYTYIVQQCIYPHLNTSCTDRSLRCMCLRPILMKNHGKTTSSKNIFVSCSEKIAAAQ